MSDNLTLTGEYAYANDFEVRLRALTELAPPSRDRSALTTALKPLAVDGTTISFSFSVGPPDRQGK